MMEGTEEVNKPTNNKVLIWVLAVFGFLVVVLLILIIIFVLNKPPETGADEEDEDTTSVEIENNISEEEYIEMLESGDESYQISLNISDVYDSGNKEEALDMYDEELSKSLEQQDYELYLDLLSTRSTMLEDDDRCADAVSYYDSVDYTRLPKEYRMAFYYNAFGVSASCDDQQHMDFWDQKIEQGLNEGD